MRDNNAPASTSTSTGTWLMSAYMIIGFGLLPSTVNMPYELSGPLLCPVAAMVISSSSTYWELLVGFCLDLQA